MSGPDFQIDAQPQAEHVRLRLTGDLDLASVPVLKRRLEELCAQKRSVRLDLSGVDFIDSSGMHLLITAFKDARADGCRLEVDPWLAPNVEQSLRLARLEGMITSS